MKSNANPKAAKEFQTNRNAMIAAQVSAYSEGEGRINGKLDLSPFPPDASYLNTTERTLLPSSE